VEPTVGTHDAELIETSTKRPDARSALDAVKSRTLIVTIVVGLVLGSLGIVFLRQVGPDERSTNEGALRREAATTASPSPTVPTTGFATSGSPGAAAPSSPTSTPPALAIETTSELYFGLPYETIPIPGRYHGVQRGTELHVQVRQPDGWRSFPLPVVTGPSGYFRAYVELGAGEYRLRLVDPATGIRSRILTLLLF
jgi:hypothetical protein